MVATVPCNDCERVCNESVTSCTDYCVSFRVITGHSESYQGLASRTCNFTENELYRTVDPGNEVHRTDLRRVVPLRSVSYRVMPFRTEFVIQRSIKAGRVVRVALL